MTPLSRSRLPWQAVVAATVLALLAALAVIAVLGGGDDDGDVTEAPQGSLELTPAEDAATGDPLDIPVTWSDDAELALAEVIEGPVVVNFFASWCPPCIAEMPDFESVSQEAGDEVEFIGVAVQDRTADATRIVEDTGVTYRWARDARGDVANAAQVTQMPSTMFIDADGEVVSLHAGALDAEALRDLLESELGVTVG